MHLDFKKGLQVFLLDPSFDSMQFYYFSQFAYEVDFYF